jgi:hypothetical protein
MATPAGGKQDQNPQPTFGGSIFGDLPGVGGASGVKLVSEDKGEYEPNASSVREWAYCEDKNFRFRPYMEDAYFTADKLGGDPSCGAFGIFDGHGGRQVSDHCAERIPAELKKALQKKPADLC